MEGIRLVTAAAHFAAMKHRSQKRKTAAGDSVPYIEHPLDAMNILAQCGVTDPEVLAAAVLHDTVEDTDTTLEEIAERFGPRVAALVAECSDDKALDKITRKRQQLEHAPSASPGAALVKLADKVSNCAGKKPDSWSKETSEGYNKWCFAVCQFLFGHNTQLDDMVKALFVKLGVSSVTDAELEEYYLVIGESE